MNDGVLTDITIETALPLIITQDTDEAKEAHTVFLASSAAVKIVAYDLTISGTLRFPGRDAVIFARNLRARTSKANTPPSIIVDGVPPPLNYEQLRAAPKASQQRYEGDQGTPGYNDRVSGPGGGQTEYGGGPGWSGPDHAAEMNGKDGKKGADRAGTDSDKRGNAGSIFICCDRMEFPLDTVLKLSANGGAGERGQPGQDGAKGGPGGAGFDGVIRTPGVSYSWPTRGGKGGKGGAGGKGGDGGKGGKGGKGGSINVHCVSATPPVSCSVRGGLSEPGEGGKGGERGDPGRPGNGFWFKPMFDKRGFAVEAAAPGEFGSNGDKGSPGRSHPGELGTYSVDSGEVPDAALAKVADSLTQLQMVFEAARGDYLATPAPDYQLQLITAADPSRLPRTGEKDSFQLALVGSKLIIRIFDSSGRLLERPEDNADSVNALKELLAAVPLRILLTSNWTVSGTTGSLSTGVRTALVQQLGKLGNQSEDYFKKLADEALVGRAAVAAFLLASGQKVDLLKKKSDDEQRKDLIAENNEKTGRSVDELQKKTNQELIGLTLTWFDWDKVIKAIDSGNEEPKQLLKQLFEAVPLRTLLAGDRKFPDQKLSTGDRAALVQQLGALTNQSEDYYETLPDPNLIGSAAVAAFLLASGRCDKTLLKSKSDNDQRNDIISANNTHTGRSVGELQGMTNRSGDALNQLFEVVPPHILVKGDWALPGKTYALAAGERTALVGKLAALSNQSAENLQKLADAELIDRAAVSAFLLAARLRDKVWLKTKTGDEQRTELIAANSQHTGRSKIELNGMTSRELVALGLEWFDWFACIVWAKRAAERAASSNARREALKRRFEVLPGVLLGGDQNTLSADDRTALVDRLADLTNKPEGYFQKLDDAGLIGKGVWPRSCSLAGLATTISATS
jgi:hypothetical protein